MLTAMVVAGVVLVAVAASNQSAGSGEPADTPDTTPVVETALPTPEPSERGCPSRGGGASSAPELSARTASVTRLERDGSLTWTRALPVDDLSRGDFPPLVLGERTLVLAGGTLRSYATATGQENWVVPADGAPYGLWHSADTVVVLLDQVSQNARLLGFDPETGELRWTHRIPNNGLMGDQVLADGALATVLSGGNQVQVVDSRTGSVRWTAAQGGGPRLTVAGAVVVQPGGGKLNAYRLQDGTPAWSTPVPQDEVAVTSAAGVVLTTATVQGPGFETGVRAYDPATGVELWARPGGQQALRLAGEVPGAVLIADDDFAAATLAAVDARTGAELWKVRARTVYDQAIVTGSGVLAVPERRKDSYVVARRDLRTGELLDEAPLPGELSLQPLDGERYLFQTYGGFGEPAQVTVRSLATGEQEFATTVRHAARPPASLPGGAVILQGVDPGRGCIG